MKVVAVDIETTGLTWKDRVLVVGAAVREGAGPIQSSSAILTAPDLFSTQVTMPEAINWMQRLIVGADWLVMHNASFDLPHLFRLGMLTPEEVKGRVFDTLVMAACTAGHDRLGLDALCDEYKIDTGPGWKTMKGKRKDLKRLPISETAAYCEQDCVATLKLYDVIAPLADKIYTRRFVEREGDFCSLLARMRVRGITLNLPFITDRVSKNEARYAECLDVFKQVGITTPNDRTGLLTFLRSRKVKLSVYTPAGEPSVDKDALERAVQKMQSAEDREILERVLEARNLEKEDSTFLTGFIKQADSMGVVHPSFFSGGTKTWRLSSSEPNAQNIPRVLQADIFQASQPGGALCVLDYSQAQLRIAAMYAKENQMAKAFAKPDADIHLSTAIALFGEIDGPKRRSDGKAANFAVLFGSGAAGVAENYGLDLKTAAMVLARHKAKFPKLEQGSKATARLWRERGYIILPYGKRIYAKPMDLAEGKDYKAWNYRIQGAEGVIMQEAMLKLDEAGIVVVSQQHDSGYLDVPPDEDPEEVCREAAIIMEKAVPEALKQRTDPPINMPTEAKIRRRAL